VRRELLADDGRALAAIEQLAATHRLSAGQAESLARYVELLLGWRKANVTGLSDPVALVDALLGDSLALIDVSALRAREAGPWIDLGAGAGVPGVPLAIALPRARVTLLDAASKKCTFLEEAIRVTGLDDRARVVCSRSEHHAATGAPGREAHTVVLARALAEMAVIVELAAPLLAIDGMLLASKTRRALEEEGLTAQDVALRCGLVYEGPVPLASSPLDDAVCAVFRKVRPTPAWLPRREGMAVKRPLGA
jgi:16S rRNA (guanine527-N7)-methyltransferase